MPILALAGAGAGILQLPDLGEKRSPPGSLCDSMKTVTSHLSGSSLEKGHSQSWTLFDLTQSSISGEVLSPRWFVKIKQEQLFKIAAACGAGIPVGTNNGLAKQFKRELWGMKHP